MFLAYAMKRTIHSAFKSEDWWHNHRNKVRYTIKNAPTKIISSQCACTYLTSTFLQLLPHTCNHKIWSNGVFFCKAYLQKWLDKIEFQFLVSTNYLLICLKTFFSVHMMDSIFDKLKKGLGFWFLNSKNFIEITMNLCRAQKLIIIPYLI